MKVTGMNRTTEQRNLLRIYSIDKKENSICLQICSNKTEEKIEESQKKGDSDMAEFDYEVVNGRKIRVRPVETVSEVDENGYFVRQPNHFTEGFGEGKNPVEAGRYRLVWAKLCHWSNRASIVRELLGLDEAISVNMVDHADHEKNLGWEFVYDKDNVDPVLDIQFLSEAYYKADDDYTGRTTVPALIDVKTGKVVNNDYHKLTNYFEVDFKPFHKKNAPDLYPEELRNEIDEMNYWLFDNINNGVYKTTFCRSKEAYWDAYNSFYAAMDLLEERLENQRFLFGDYVTDSDVRLYVTLARLDIRYTHQLGHTKHPLFTYKNLWGYARDLYQIPAFKNNTYFKDFANPDNKKQGRTFESFNASATVIAAMLTSLFLFIIHSPSLYFIRFSAFHLYFSVPCRLQLFFRHDTLECSGSCNLLWICHITKFFIESNCFSSGVDKDLFHTAFCKPIFCRRDCRCSIMLSAVFLKCCDSFNLSGIFIQLMQSAGRYRMDSIQHQYVFISCLIFTELHLQ